MRYVLGVDGGASKTLAVLADERGQVLGIGRAGNGNFEGVGLEPALQEIQNAGEAALRMANVRPEEVEVACYCLAGADFPEDFDLLRGPLGELALAPRTTLHNDTTAALFSGTSAPNAVTVIVGSGSNAAGRNAAGDEVRLAAVGWISGDWGGGGTLAQEAIWSVARAQDGRGPRTALETLVLEALGVDSADEMSRKLYFQQIEHGAVRHLAPLVFRGAEMGDAVAQEIVCRQAREVVVTATALLRRLGLLDTEADVVLGGSVFKGEGALLLGTIRRELGEVAPLARIVRPNVEPVVGAVFCGMDEAGIVVDEEVRARARESYEQAAEAAEVRR